MFIKSGMQIGVKHLVTPFEHQTLTAQVAHCDRIYRRNLIQSHLAEENSFIRGQ